MNKYTKYYNKHREKCKKYAKDYYQKHRRDIISKSMEREKRIRRELREQIIKLLGGKCSNPDCPISKDKIDIRCLQIDHINGGGYKERKKFKTSGKKYLRHVLKEIQNDSKKYQLLCVYCNWLKRCINYGEE